MSDYTSHHLEMNYYVNFLGRLGSNRFQLKNEGLAPLAIEKIKILGAVLELPAKQHCQPSPFTSKLGQIGQINNAV